MHGNASWLGTIGSVRPDEVVALFVGGYWSFKGPAPAIEWTAEARRFGASMRLWWLD